VSILAVLKAGGAYVPLDPDYPQERLNFMLSDTKSKILITRNEYITFFNNYKGESIILNQKWREIVCEYNYNLKVLHDPMHLAYVLYTSGSTGRPKGVMGLHLGMVNRMHWMWYNFPFTEKDICIQKTSINFGDSLWEIFGPLLKGTMLIIVSLQKVKDLQQLVNIMEKHLVTRLVIVPTFLDAMINYLEATRKNLKSLEYCTVSGEALPARILKNYFKTFSKTLLLNLYGSSEISADATYHPYLKPGYSDIGKPLWNTQIYILNENRELIPEGTIGEIYIGGKGLARGYISKPDFTAERFIPDPFSQEAGARLYRTGDLARYLPDGNIEYMGRIDHQVKLRGFRIELGEIEGVLRNHAEIENAIVIPGPDNQYLIGFIILKSLKLKNDVPDQFTENIKEYLRNYLPEYMIPLSIEVLSAFPLNTSGKIDYNQLKSMHIKISSRGNAYIQPKSCYEVVIINIWEKLLRIKKIGIHDNFFELGGNSLLSMQVVAEIYKQTHKLISISEIFKAPTPYSLAKKMQGLTNNISSTENILSIQTEGNNSPIFLIHPISGLSFPYYALRYYINGHPIYAINHPDFGNNITNFDTIEDMVNFYRSCIKTIAPQGPYVLGGWSFGGNVALELARIMKKEGDNIENVILIDSFNYANLSKKQTQKEVQSDFKEMLRALNISSNSKDGKKLLKIMQDNHRILFNYRPVKYTETLTLLKARVEPDEKENYIFKDAFNGWLEVCPLHLTVYSVDGSHAILFDEKYIEGIAKIIRNAIDLSPKKGLANVDSIQSTLINARKNNDIFILEKLKNYLKKESELA
jgi:amino acid adenylation domain-containing protein